MDSILTALDAENIPPGRLAEALILAHPRIHKLMYRVYAVALNPTMSDADARAAVRDQSTRRSKVLLAKWLALGKNRASRLDIPDLFARLTLAMRDTG
ncbi:hypothetical protein H9P43_006759 [Blastocladiella emersonii ATCC 22665]|nr:hypothetical protein H9P43_006759 [Blastocladiella emersonii ATCC 22665]